MLSVNPFAILAETVSPLFMQSFVVLMVVLIAIGTLVDIIHKKNVKYFFENAKKAKLSATKNLSTGEKISVNTNDIIKRSDAKNSSMPSSFSHTMSAQDVADVTAWIMQLQ